MAVTEKDIIKKVTKEFNKWVNYTEKKSLSNLNGRSYDNPGNYNEYAGLNNYTVFAKLYKEKTGINVQGQPWCDTFVDTVFIHLFGVDTASKMLGGFSAYTPTSANYFKKMGRWHSNPQEGDIIFFKNSQRIYHTGYVIGVSGNKVKTTEGNTSTTNNKVEENGGCVANKEYLLSNPKIAGYGRPNYSLAIEKENYFEGWLKAADDKRWWYQFADGTYAKNDGKNHGWYLFDDCWYAFDKNGYMLTGHQTINGGEYYLKTATNFKEGALLASYGSHGKPNLDVWYVSKMPAATCPDNEGWVKTEDGRWWYRFSDNSYAKDDGSNGGIYIINGYEYIFDTEGYMRTGLININGREYYFCEDGPNCGRLMDTSKTTYGGLLPIQTNDVIKFD